MTDHADLMTLRLAPQAHGVALVRQAITGVGEALEMSPRLLSDIKLAVSEACTNAILHGYSDPAASAKGTLTVVARTAPGAVVITVCDDGRGVTPRIDSQGLGLGLPLIAALTTTMAIREAGSGGTEVEMTFGLHDDDA